MLKSEIRPEILAKPCAKCGQAIPEDEDSILTFFRGEFIRLHEGCKEFLETGTPDFLRENYDYPEKRMP